MNFQNQNDKKIVYELMIDLEQNPNNNNFENINHLLEQIQ